MTLTCDFCAVWSAVQWERFNKKHSYKERKKHRPSGSVPPRSRPLPARKLLREFRALGLLLLPLPAL